MDCIFIGYSPDSSSYIVYNEERRRAYNRRYEDVVFDERSHAPDGIEPDVKIVETALAQMDLLHYLKKSEYHTFSTSARV